MGKSRVTIKIQSLGMRQEDPDTDCSEPLYMNPKPGFRAHDKHEAGLRSRKSDSAHSRDLRARFRSTPKESAKALHEAGLGLQNARSNETAVDPLEGSWI